MGQVVQSRMCKALRVPLLLLALAGCGGDGGPESEVTGSLKLGSQTRIYITFESRGAKIRGWLDVPAVAASKGPVPALVWVHGSGDERLDDRAAVYAEQLDPRFAFFNHERNPKPPDGFDDIAADTLAAASAVHEHDAVDDDAVGLVALGVGGWVTPLVLTKSKDVSFAVVFSGPVVSVGEENLFEKLTGNHPCAPTGISDAEIQRRVNAAGPSHFDPRPALKRVNVPVLWVYGDRDRQQPVAKDIGVLKALKREGRPFTWVVLPKANHELLATEGTGACWEGGRRGGRLSPRLGPTVNGWLRSNVG